MRAEIHAKTDRLGTSERRAPRPLPPVLKSNRPSEIPLSVSQSQWVPQGKNPSRDILVPIVLRFEGHLNARALNRAVAQAADRNEALRTSFRAIGSELHPEIRSTGSVSINHVSMKTVAASDQIEAVWDHINRQYGEPFRIEQDALRLTLFELNSKDHILAGFVSHMVFDGVSFALFWGEVLAGYRSAVLGFGHRPPPELQYADFALWEANWLSEDAHADAKEFWRGYLSGAAPIDAPSARLQSGEEAPMGATPFKLPDDVFARGLEFARQRRTTFNHVFLAALSVLLADSPEKPTPFSYITRARPPRFNTTIGCFMQIRALMPDIGDNPTFETLVSRTRSHLAATSDLRRPLPFEISKHFRLGQILVNYNASSSATSNQSIPVMGVATRVFHLPRDVKTRVSRNLQFAVSQTAAGLEGSITYASDAFDDNQARSISERLAACIARAIDAPETRISDLMQPY